MVVDPLEGRTRVRPGQILALLAGAVVFSLVVWLAFALGSWRMRPDLALDAAVTLDAVPQIEFDAERHGWEIVAPADEATGQGPQYASDAADDEALCVFSWQTGSVVADAVDLGDASTDGEATQVVLDAAGLMVGDLAPVQVRTSTGQTLELMHAQEERDDGLVSASAVRAFVGSRHYVILTLVCDAAETMTSELTAGVLEDARVVLDVAR